MIKIYHNPRCRKSRETLKILQEKGKQIEIIQYLETPPSQEELKSIISKLGVKAEDIIRKGETVFKQNYKGKSFTEEQWIKILAENPVLIERPIVLTDDKAVIGRPPENVNKLL